MSEWQPIETAPLVEGKPMLVYAPDEVPEYRFVVATIEDFGGEHEWQVVGGNMWRVEPTHWMPLPDPPAETRR